MVVTNWMEKVTGKLTGDIQSGGAVREATAWEEAEKLGQRGDLSVINCVILVQALIFLLTALLHVFQHILCLLRVAADIKRLSSLTEEEVNTKQLSHNKNSRQTSHTLKTGQWRKKGDR